MQYVTVTSSDQRNHLVDQIAFFERQYFAKLIGLKVEKASATPDAIVIADLQDDLVDIDSRHAAAINELAKFDSATTTANPSQTTAQPDTTF